MAINREVRVDYVGRDKTQAAVASVSGGIDRVKAQLASMAKNAVTLQRTFGALTLGFAGANGVKTLGQMQDSLIRVRGLTEDYAGAQKFLAEQTRALNIDIQDAASAYADILVLQNTGYINSRQTADLFVGFQESAKRFGISATDVQFALRGLRQAMTAGVVRAQEFDQIFDAIGAVIPDVAKNLGVTSQELLKMRSSASLSSDALLKALIPALLESQGAAASASENINASLKRISNSYKEALLTFEEPINDGVAAFADGAIAAIDGVVEHSDKIKIVGIAIASAYGGKALTAIGAYVAAQKTAISSSFAHTQALAVNNALLAEQATAALNVARSEQASLVSQRQALQAELARTTATKARLALHGQLEAARAREIAGLAALQAANAKATAATGALAASQRAASLSSIALSGAMNTLKGAMALAGGPVGVAIGVIAGLVIHLRNSTKEARNLQNAFEELDDRARVLGSRAFDEITREREEAEIKLNKLIDERAELLAKEGDYMSKNPIVAGQVESKLRELNKQISFFQDTLSSIELKEDQFKAADAAKEKIDALIASANEFNKVIDTQPIIDKWLPDRAKIKELEDALNNARKAFEPDDKDGQAVQAAIQAEIDALTGAEKARESYRQKIKDAKKELDSLNQSLETERQKIESTFRNAEQTVLLNVEIGTIDESAATNVLAKARERMNAALDELNQQQLDAERQAIADKKAILDQEYADRIAHQQRMAAALSVVDPQSGELERFRIQVQGLIDERNKDLISQEDYYTLVQAAAKDHNDAMAQIIAQQSETERKRFADLSNYDKIYQTGSIANTFFDAFKKNVDSYITITENMTDAERANAETSNRINRKRFEDNKKASIAQAIISTITGATRAFETVPYPANFAAAAAITAAGLRNVANIRSSTFGSGTGGSVATGASISNQQTELTANDQPQANVSARPIIVLMPGARQGDFLNTGRDIKKLVDTGYITQDEAGQLDLRNISDGEIRQVS